jgi:hypothetical protein
MTFSEKIHQIFGVDTDAGKIVRPSIFADIAFKCSLASTPEIKPDTAKIVSLIHPKKHPD